MARRGRLLVECVVAMVLLSATTVVVLALARSTTRTQQHAQISALAWARSTVAVDGANGLSCLNAPAIGEIVTPRMTLSWTDGVSARYRQRDLLLTPTLSALAGPVTVPLALRAARYCP